MNNNLVCFFVFWKFLFYEVESSILDMVEVLGYTMNFFGEFFCEFIIKI